jgi:uncharacterized protein YjbJ (UPF0337 family)
MARSKIEGKWNQIKGSVKQKYGELFKNNDAYINGKFDEVIGKIQVRSGKTREEIEQDIKEWKV